MILPQQIVRGISLRQLTPEFVRATNTDFSASTSWAFDILVTPIEGNLMVLCIGGSQSRTPTFPGGWNVVNMTGSTNTLSIGWKFAGAGEPTSVTITFDANLQGNATYFEFSNVDTINTVIPGGGTASAFITQTSFSWGASSPFNASVYIQQIQFTDAETSISVDNGYTMNGSSTARHRAAYKIYSGPVSSPETTLWSFSSASGSIGLLGFKGKVI